jgi:cell division protein FtsQ
MSPTATRPRPAAGAASRRRSGMDPRISARRVAVTRQQGRRRLWLLITLAALTALVVGAWFLLHTSLFSARAITVVGATHETSAQVVAESGLAGHPPMIDIDAGAVARDVEQLPWVASATVSVHWPDGVRITVTEEVPRLVVAAPSNRWAELSADGRVLSVSATRPPGLILVSGPAAPGAPGSDLGSADRAALRVATTLPASFAAQVTAVGVEPGGWVQLTMTTPILVDIGTPSDLGAKYEDVSSILAGATLHNGDVIDVSVPGAPTVTAG